MAFDASFFALVGLVLFFVLIAYLKVPGMLSKSLDERAQNIQDELAEAKRLREEAQHLLAARGAVRRRAPRPQVPQQAEHVVGDHYLSVGQVVALDGHPDAEPLLFFRSAFGAWSATSQNATSHGATSHRATSQRATSQSATSNEESS